MDDTQMDPIVGTDEVTEEAAMVAEEEVADEAAEEEVA